MTMPTVNQIEKDVALPTYAVRVYSGGSWVTVSADIADDSGDYALSASPSDGIGFGLAPAPRRQIRFSKERYGLAWDRSPIEVSLGFEGNNPVHFLGLITGLDQDGVEGTWSASGWQYLLSEVGEIRSPLLARRPVFTATSVASIEDPSDSNWRGGLGNYILWKAGGRPVEQSATYPSAPWYYRCERAMLAPDFSWIDAGDPAKALDDLCRVAGGVLFQDMDGTLVYQEPFGFASGSPVVHYTDSALATTAAGRIANNLAQYGRARRSLETRQQVVDQVVCSFTQRRLQGVQEIYSDRIPRRIAAGASSTETLSLELPCYRVDRVVAVAATLQSAREVTASQLTLTITQAYAQQVAVTLTNTLSEDIGLHELRVYGQPLVAMEAATVTAGSPVGAYPRVYSVPTSALIQSKSHARRLANLYKLFFDTARPVVELTGCGFDPRRRLGDIVTLTSADLGITAENHRIIGIRPSRTGKVMDLSLVSVTGLPTRSQLFQLGQTYAGSDTRKLLY